MGQLAIYAKHCTEAGAGGGRGIDPSELIRGSVTPSPRSSSLCHTLLDVAQRLLAHRFSKKCLSGFKAIAHDLRCYEPPNSHPLCSTCPYPAHPSRRRSG